jgi:hypothetical protein
MARRGGGVAGPSRGKAVAALTVFVAARLACAGATLLVWLSDPWEPGSLGTGAWDA